MFWAYLSTLALVLVGFMLMVIILLQRGRGGGLAGAFGGLGGQSAFGTKAGDVFTKITVVLAVIWVALAGASIWALEKSSGGRYQNALEPPVSTAPESDGTGGLATDSKTPEQPTGGALLPHTTTPATSETNTSSGTSSAAPGTSNNGQTATDGKDVDHGDSPAKTPE